MPLGWGCLVKPNRFEKPERHVLGVRMLERSGLRATELRAADEGRGLASSQPTVISTRPWGGASSHTRSTVRSCLESIYMPAMTTSPLLILGAV